MDGPPGAFLSFDLKSGEVVQAKIGMSFTSVEEARRNLEAEIPDWNYQRVEDEARSKWSAALETIQIGKSETTPDSDAKRHIFYTALYHSMLLPLQFSDVDGAIRVSPTRAEPRSPKASSTTMTSPYGIPFVHCIRSSPSSTPAANWT